MKTSSGDIITQYDLHRLEEVSLIKIDLLSIEALDRIRACLDLLTEYDYLDKKLSLRERYEQAMKAKEFFMLFMNADCDHIAIENPTPLKIVNLPKPSQVVQPYEYGDPYSKRTLLWLKDLPLLKPTNILIYL